MSSEDIIISSGRNFTPRVAEQELIENQAWAIPMGISLPEWLSRS